MKDTSQEKKETDAQEMISVYLELRVMLHQNLKEKALIKSHLSNIRKKLNSIGLKVATQTYDLVSYCEFEERQSGRLNSEINFKQSCKKSA